MKTISKNTKTTLLLLAMITLFVIISFIASNNISYAENEYTITYSAGYYSSQSDVIEYKTIDVDYQIASVGTFIREGYSQSGWSINSDGSTEDYAFNSTYSTNENLVLYPIWTINQYTITFDTDGGTEITAVTQDYGTDVVAPSIPTKIGYTFNGWDKTIPSTMPAENITITASWTINQYTITFDTDGGTEITAITQDYGTSVVAPSDPTKTGYTFNSWDAAIPTTIPNEDTTITATWTINQYTITFDTDGGTEITAITQDYGTSVVEPEDPTKTGYSFNGWDAAIPTTMPNEDTTITATWTINQYTITFDTDGGTEIEAITQDYGTSVVAPSNPTKTGYTFNSWDAAIPSTIGAENITITASWTANLYTITFDTNGGNYCQNKLVTFDSNYTLEIPIKVGYVFNYWEDELHTIFTNNEGVSLLNWNTDSGLQLYANWTEIELSLSSNKYTFNNDLGNTLSLVATITPNGSTDVEWNTSNSSVATVDSNGIVTAVGLGFAIITLSAEYGDATAECEIYVVNFVVDLGEDLYFIKLNENIDYACLCDKSNQIIHIMIELNSYISNENEYVIRDNGTIVDENSIVEDSFSDGIISVNLKYNITKVEKNVTFSVADILVEYGQEVKLSNIVASSNYEVGKIKVEATSGVGSVTISQKNKLFIMPDFDVTVMVLVSQVTSLLNEETVMFYSTRGFNTATTISISEIGVNNKDSNLVIPEGKSIVKLYNVTIKIDNIEQSDGAYYIVMKVPEELYGKDGIEVVILNGTSVEEKQVTIDNGYISFECMQMGNIALVCKSHDSAINLTWLIILLDFLDSFAFVALVILYVKYYDGLQRKKNLNIMSVAISPMILLCATVKGGQLAGVIMLALILIAEVTGIIWLLLRLADKDFMFISPMRLITKIKDNKQNNNNNVVKDDEEKLIN